MKKLLIILAAVLAALILAVGGYVGYVAAAYHRIGDTALMPEGTGSRPLEAGETYGMVSWNIGFGAYESDYGFFMDGGKQSRAWSPTRLRENMMKIAETLAAQDADLYLIQEVDTDATRTYHTDEREYLISSMIPQEYMSVYAPNYDSPYLLVPPYQPHGASKSGIMTFSRFAVSSARRVELPVESGFMKLIDLDRCYSKSRLPVEGGRELVLYNFHLSAYTSDGRIAATQLEMMISDMKGEYERGNWCIAGGDFNKDLIGGENVFGVTDDRYNWAQPLPEGIFKGTGIRLIAPFDENDPMPSCRNADSAYHEGQYVITVDGFMVSENVEITSSAVINTGFAYSDHNPVRMEFVLTGMKR